MTNQNAIDLAETKIRVLSRRLRLQNVAMFLAVTLFVGLGMAHNDGSNAATSITKDEIKTMISEAEHRANKKIDKDIANVKSMIYEAENRANKKIDKDLANRTKNLSISSNGNLTIESNGGEFLFESNGNISVKSNGTIKGTIRPK